MVLGAVAALFLSFGLLPAALAQSVVLSEDVASTLPSGANFKAPKGWRLEERGTVQLLTAPEGDSVMAVVDAIRATDATAAIAAAWKTARPGFSLAPKLVTPHPGREGWDDRAVADYETSPNEKKYVRAEAYRKGDQWSVVLVDAAEATSDKRVVAISQVFNSLRAPGYIRETFAGRTAHKLDSARVGALTDFLDSGMKQLGVPGAAYALVQNKKVIAMGGLGVKKLGNPDPVDADTQFMVASNIKGMSTLMLATLVDERKFAWDDPVTKVYPSFRLGDAATTAQVEMRHLVCACTGLPNKDMEWLFNTPRGTDPASVFAHLAATQPTSGFGEVFQYNNLITTAAGFIGGHVAHPNLPVAEAYDRAMAERVFGPLGMNNTHFSFERALKSNIAWPHGMDFNGQPAIASVDVSYSIIPFRPAAGAWSTARDMAKYAALELSEGVLPNGTRLVSQANLLERRKRGISLGEDSWYGMGITQQRISGVPVIYHGGAMPGYRSNFWVFPDSGVAGVLLTNANNGNALLRPFMRRILEVLYDGKEEAAATLAASAELIKARVAEEREKLVVPPALDASRELATSYHSRELGRLRVTKGHNGRLRFNFTAWSSEMASRKNKDGTISFVTIDPATERFAFVMAKQGSKRTLILRVSQHEYVFLEE